MTAQSRLLAATLIFLTGLAAVAGFAGAARSDMLIRLKDGRVLTVPVDENEVGAITYGKGTGNRPVAKRAADRIREDAEDARFASEAADRAASAAARAEEAARVAAEAAEQAKTAQREAHEAAETAKRLAHKPPEPTDIPHPARSARPQKAAEEPAATPGKPASRVLAVGKGKRYALPSMAARDARDGDTVEIQAGTYRGDVAVWRADNLVIRGVGGRVLLDAAGKSARGKATWVIKGRNTTIQNIAFTGSRVRDLNGAGIRLEGPGLVVRDCEFFDNQMGILTGTNPESDVLIERSRFYRNTVDYPRYGRLGHNIYIGRVRSFTLRFSHVSGAEYGHNVKSRAGRNVIAYNMIADGADGFSSYLIDLPSGGLSTVVGNVLHQSPKADNWAMVSFGAEDSGATQALYVVNNTFVNEKKRGVFIQRKTAGTTLVSNNILAGGGTVLTGEGEITANLIVDEAQFGRLRALFSDGAARPAEGPLEGNLVAPAAGFADPARMDFHLTSGSPAIDAAARPPVVEGDDLTPLFQYAPPTAGVPRPVHGKLDIGAYEYAGR